MIDLTLNSDLSFGSGKNNNNADFRILASELSVSYDFLIFTDSKGTSIGNNKANEWTIQILNLLETNSFSFLFVSRPKEMTTFFTLLNFINYNDIIFTNLITNIGFVDLTPKKAEFIDDIISQNPFPNEKLQKIELCEYILNSGKLATLYSLNLFDVSKQIAAKIKNNFSNAFFIETFEFDSEINIDRVRPTEFYSQLKVTNKFLKLICSYFDSFNLIAVNENLPKNCDELSYDAVHFTQAGHDRYANICFKKLNI
jgi:hypothetical protein